MKLNFEKVSKQGLKRAILSPGRIEKALKWEEGLERGQKVKLETAEAVGALA